MAQSDVLRYLVFWRMAKYGVGMSKRAVRAPRNPLQVIWLITASTLGGRDSVVPSQRGQRPLIRGPKREKRAILRRWGSRCRLIGGVLMEWWPGASLGLCQASDIIEGAQSFWTSGPPSCSLGQAPTERERSQAAGAGQTGYGRAGGTCSGNMAHVMGQVRGASAREKGAA